MRLLSLWQSRVPQRSCARIMGPRCFGIGQYAGSLSWKTIGAAFHPVQRQGGSIVKAPKGAAQSPCCLSVCGIEGFSYRPVSKDDRNLLGEILPEHWSVA